MADNAYPSLVLVIRHGEKPGAAGDDKDGGPHLSIRGSARAAALPALFIPGDKPAAGTGRTVLRDVARTTSGQVLGTYTFGTVKASSSRFPDAGFSSPRHRRTPAAVRSRALPRSPRRCSA